MANEFAHGRNAFSDPLPNPDGLLFVVFSGEGPLPDYDIGGWEGDIPIGGYPIQRTKISRDYKHYADALFNWEKEGTKKITNRPRGALYIYVTRRRVLGQCG